MRLSNSAAALLILSVMTTVVVAQSKLPDGQPDIQGMYTRAGVKSVEADAPFNPIDPGEKNPFSVSNREDGLGPYPRIFGAGGNVLRGSQQRVQRVGVGAPSGVHVDEPETGAQDHAGEQ